VEVLVRLNKIVVLKSFVSNGGHSYESRVDRGFSDVPHKLGDVISIEEQRTWHHNFLRYLEQKGLVKIEVLTECPLCHQALS
jgi:hypothetical protein